MPSPDRERAIACEAGHAVIALHFGFTIHSIRLTNGSLESIITASPERNANELGVFAAAGIAGKTLCFPESGCDQEKACRSDKAAIDGLGSDSIETFLPTAIRILESQPASLLLLRRRLEIAWFEGEFRIARALGPSDGSLILLTQKDVEAVWRATVQKSSMVAIEKDSPRSAMRS